MTTLRLEPVRIYAVVSAVLLLVAHYVPDLPVPLILAVAAALLGVGEFAVRANVTPVAKTNLTDTPED